MLILLVINFLMMQIGDSLAGYYATHTGNGLTGSGADIPNIIINNAKQPKVPHSPQSDDSIYVIVVHKQDSFNGQHFNSNPNPVYEGTPYQYDIKSVHGPIQPISHHFSYDTIQPNYKIRFGIPTTKTTTTTFTINAAAAGTHHQNSQGKAFFKNFYNNNNNNYW